MTVTIYTLTDCPFCASAKQYFQDNNITFVEKNVENNPADLEEMQQLSNKFPGVPYVHVVKDDGTTEGLRGFTKEDFDKVFKAGSANPTEAPAEPAMPAPVAMEDKTTPMTENPLYQPEPVSPMSAPVDQSAAMASPSVTPEPVAPEPAAPSPAPAPAAAPANANDLEETLQKLQDQLKPAPANEPATMPAPMASEPVMPEPAAPTMAEPSPAPMPTMTQDVAAPTVPPAIPDFPQASSMDSTSSPQASTPQAGSGQMAPVDGMSTDQNQNPQL